jgi:hypothetical protein
VLSKEDSAIQQVLSSMEGQISAMITAGQTVERINEELGAGYISGASTVFRSKVQDWVDSYKLVMQKFQHCCESTSGASSLLNQAEEEAQVTGGNWGASDGVFHGLTPNAQA